MMILYRIISIGSIQLGTFSQQNTSYAIFLELLFFRSLTLSRSISRPVCLCVSMCLLISRSIHLLITSRELIECGRGFQGWQKQPPICLCIYVKFFYFVFNFCVIYSLSLRRCCRCFSFCFCFYY